MKKSSAECLDLNKILKLLVVMDDIQMEVLYRIVLLLNQHIIDVKEISSHVDIQVLKEKRACLP